MTIFVARHGETEWNALDKVCGRSDIPLSEKGHTQAKLLAEKLKSEQDKNQITRIFVSPLTRARQTCAYIENALGLIATVEDDLIEMNFGTSEGKNLHSSEFNKFKEEPFLHFPNGESYMELSFRAKRLLQKLYSQHQSENILLVCHGALGRAIATCFHDFTIEQFKHMRMKNCELCKYEM